jgi:DnaJ-class molecular chaperone
MMKGFDGLNYYEVLDVASNASSFEIRQAYKEALSIYDEDSVSTYTLFSGDEREGILQRIEKAFHTLIDDDKREAYEKHLIDAGELDASLLKKEKSRKAVPLFQNDHPKEKGALGNRIRDKIRKKTSQVHSDDRLSKDVITGEALREIRESLGIELQDIFEVTRIRVSILSAIEADRFDVLPPMVYVKNFLRSYGEILGLDPQIVADGYCKHMTRNA